MKLEKIVRKTQSELKRYAANTLRSAKYNVVSEKGFLYAAGEHPVLLVAHLDTVHRQPVQRIFYTKDGSCMMSPEGIGGDDRCGVYMALTIAQEIKCSILLCEDEEIGGIGADAFAERGIKVDANYIIEFDRRGSNDAVFYDCDNEEFVAFVEKFGFIEDYGSFSDISTVAPALKLAAVNLSCGYYNAHTNHEYINLREMENVMERAKKMILEKSKRFEYIPAKPPTRYGGWSTLWDTDDPRYWEKDSKIVGLKYLPKEMNATVSTTADTSWFSGEDVFIGEDDHLYYVDECFDVAVLVSGNAYTADGTAVIYDDIDEEELLFEVVTAADLLDMYNGM